MTLVNLKSWIGSFHVDVDRNVLPHPALRYSRPSCLMSCLSFLPSYLSKHTRYMWSLACACRCWRLHHGRDKGTAVAQRHRGKLRSWCSL